MNRRATLITLLACGWLVPLTGSAQDKDKTAATEEWTSLFDGKTLGNWSTADGTPGTWEVVDGMIHGSGPASHLFSPRGSYKNFKYKAEIKIADKANSGMYFRTKKEPGLPSRLRGPGQQHPHRPGQDGLALQPRQGSQDARAARHLVHPGDRGCGQPHHHQGDTARRRSIMSTRTTRSSPATSPSSSTIPRGQVWIRKVEIIDCLTPPRS